MKINKKVLIPVLSILALSAVAIGTTYALFTSNAKNEVSIGSGKVSIKSTGNVTGAKSLGATKTGETADEHLVFTGDDAKFSGDYTWHNATVAGGTAEFENGGTISIVDGIVEIDKLTPGDHGNFEMKITNESNVDFKYRWIFECDDDEAKCLEFCSALKFKFADSGSIYDLDHFKKYVSEWKVGTAGGTINPIAFEVELPINKGNEYQDCDCNMKFTIEAVQGNAATSNENAGAYYIASAASEKITEDQTVSTVIATSEEAAPSIPAASAVVSAADSRKIAQDIIPSVKEPGTTYDVDLGLVIDAKDDASNDAIKLDIGLNATLTETTDSVIVKTTEKVKSVTEYVTVQVVLDAASIGDKNVSVTHSGVSMVKSADVADDKGAGVFTYDNATGILIIKTKTFSPFDVYYDTNVVKIGETIYATIDDALKAVKDGETISLAGGTFTGATGVISNLKDKTITIKGVGARSVFVTGNGSVGGEGACDYRFEGAKVTFKNCAIKPSRDNDNYQGFVRPTKLNFDNCTFYGRISYWGNDCTIENSTFEHGDAYDYCLWTWGCANMVIRNCVFNTQGKAIKYYGAGTCVLTVENCKFYSNGKKATADKPCIAINTGDYVTNYTLYINNCTEQGFVAGATGSAMFGSDLLSEVQGNLNVYQDGVLVWENGAPVQD